MKKMQNWASGALILMGLTTTLTFTSCEQEIIEPTALNVEDSINIETGGDDDPVPPCSNCKN